MSPAAFLMQGGRDCGRWNGVVGQRLCFSAVPGRGRGGSTVKMLVQRCHVVLGGVLSAVVWRVVVL